LTRYTSQHATTRYNTLQHATTRCNTLQHAATRYNTLQHAATRCNTLQHAATRYNTLQHATTRCNTLQHAATRCNAPQYPALPCVSLAAHLKSKKAVDEIHRTLCRGQSVGTQRAASYQRFHTFFQYWFKIVFSQPCWNQRSLCVCARVRVCVCVCVYVCVCVCVCVRVARAQRVGTSVRIAASVLRMCCKRCKCVALLGRAYVYCLKYHG